MARNLVAMGEKGRLAGIMEWLHRQVIINNFQLP